MSQSRRQRTAARVNARLGAGVLVAAAFLFIPHVAGFDGRAFSPSNIGKDDLFTAAIADGLSEIPRVVADGRDLQIELLAANGGWYGDEMPSAGSGTFTVATGTAPAPEAGRRVVAVLVRTEDGIPVEVSAFAEEVMTILNDPRGWGSVDGVSFARTDVDAEADIVLTLASPATTDELCGELPTNGYTSCGRGRPVNINGDRWVEGAAAFMTAGGTIEEYRSYVINHEVGHSLSHPHEQCPAPGELAPVMLQQTLTVGSCIPNGWPNP